MGTADLEVNGALALGAYNLRGNGNSPLRGSMNNVIRLAGIALLFVTLRAEAQETKAAPFQSVPELGYRVAPDFFHTPHGMTVGEASGVALNSKGHIFLFQRATPMLSEYDEHGTYLRSLGEGLFTHPHGLRIDEDDNLGPLTMVVTWYSS